MNEHRNIRHLVRTNFFELMKAAIEKSSPGLRYRRRRLNLHTEVFPQTHTPPPPCTPPHTQHTEHTEQRKHTPQQKHTRISISSADTSPLHSKCLEVCTRKHLDKLFLHDVNISPDKEVAKAHAKTELCVQRAHCTSDSLSLQQREKEKHEKRRAERKR